MNTTSIFVVALVIACFMHGCCFTLETNRILTGGPYYYTAFSKFHIPFRPTGRISLERARTLERCGYGYFEAYYDDSGRIVLLRSLSKDREALWTDRYFYRPDSTPYKRVMEMDDGSVRIHFFD